MIECRRPCVGEELALMAALEELKKKLSPLFDAEKGLSSSSSLDPNDSYLVSFFLVIFVMKKSFFIMFLMVSIFVKVIRWWNC